MEAIALETDAKDGLTTITARIDGKDQRLACAKDGWKKGRGLWGKLAEQPVAASGAWTSENSYVAKLCFYETPYISTVTFKFSGDEVTVSSETNVGFGATREQPLVGKAQ